jgi:hypothetical protein
MDVTDELLDKDGEIVTSCRECGFAIFDELGLTQKGCQLNRTEKFEANDLAERINTDGIEHFKIKTVCNAQRPKDWVAGRMNPTTDVMYEIRLTVDFVLVTDEVDSPENFTSRLLTSCYEINKQKEKPERAVFVIPNGTGVKFREIADTIRDNCIIPYEIVRVFEPTATKDDLMDMGVARCKSRYVAVYSLGHKIDRRLVFNLNRAINKHLQRFLLLTTENNFDGLVFSRQLHKMVDGNKEKPVWGKIQELAKLQNNMEMVKPLNEILK